MTPQDLAKLDATPRAMRPEHIALRDRAMEALRTGDLPDRDSARKAARFALKSTFMVEGYESYERVLSELRDILPSPALDEPEAEVLAAAGRFGELADLCHARWAEAPDDVKLFNRYLRSLLLIGDIPQAAALTRDRLLRAKVTERPGLRHYRNMVRLMHSLGQTDALHGFYDGPRAHVDRLVSDRTPDPADLRPGTPADPCYVINLDRDTQRLARITGMVGDALSLTRIVGTSGNAVPDALLARAGVKVSVPRRSQIGCHLSHLKAWETVANTCAEGDHALIMEDDAQFIYGPGAGLARARELAAEHQLDILFVNDLASSVGGFTGNRMDIASVDDAFQAAYARQREVPKAWGGEGYLLSPMGARRLMELELEVGISAALDWQIAVLSMADPTIIPEGRFHHALARRAAELKAHGGLLRGGVLTLPIIRQVPYGYTAHVFEHARDLHGRAQAVAEESV